jgi:preprotein translocase subunit SecD
MEAILRSHPVATLKKEISKTNVKGYSKMRKAEVVELMLKHKEKFNHIKFNDEQNIKNIRKKEKEKMKQKFQRVLEQTKKEPKSKRSKY